VPRITQRQPDFQRRALAGMPIRGRDFKFRHQKKVENAVAIVGLSDDYGAAGLRLGDEITVGDVETAAVRHSDYERAEGFLAKRRTKLLDCHTGIITRPKMR